MWAGAYEPELVNLFKKVLKPGMIVLDVGANIGYFSALAAALVGNCGQVHAFEPAPPCVPRLKKNLVPFPWAHAYFNAVGDELCTTRLYYSDRGNETGWGSLLSKENTSTDETMVSMVRLDDWASSRAVRRIDFIKLDIEGGEYRALKGAESLLRQYRPVVVAELNDVCLRRDSRMPQDVLLLLRTMQYNTFSFNDGVLGIPKDGASQTGALHEFTREPL
jgi:FkbM family methyltransferase